jgi:hypothetical protein
MPERPRQDAPKHASYLAEQEGDMDEASHGNVLGTIAADIGHVSSGRYRGQRFGNIDRWNDGWLPAR